MLGLSPGIAPRLKNGAVALLLAGALGVFVWVTHRHYPLQHWLFWRYAGYWLTALGLVGASLSLGNLVVGALARRRLAELEHWVVSFGVGLFAFELLIFVVGLLRGFQPVAFFLLPAGAIAVGAVPLYRRARRLLRHLAAARRRAARAPAHHLAFIAFGLLQLGLLYVLILVPDNAQFDARWKHLAIAEDYVAGGGIHRFNEGWIFSTRFHFSSMLFAWAFLAPGRLFDHIVLSAHLEYAVFAWTALVGIPVLVRRLAPGADPRVTWIARFLFPGVMVYDSTLSIGADHFGAMFGVPIYLLTARLWRDLEPRLGVLLGLTMAAAALVKESIAVMLVPVPAAVVAVRLLMLGWRRLRRGAEVPAGQRHWWWLGPVAAGAAAIVGTAPWWLKNLIWHGNPFYPVAARHFSPRPWTADASYLYEWGYRDYQFDPPQGWSGVWETLKVLPTFSFIPHEFGVFHGKVPTFGSLFTVLLLCLPFLRGQRRVWPLVLWVHVAIVIWFWIHAYDRYLQGVMPFMAAVTAAILVLAWRQLGRLVKVALCLLVGFQVVWGGDQYFYQTHAVVGSVPKRVLEVLGSGYRKKYEERFRTNDEWQEIGRAVPRDALLLRHESHDHLGAGVRTVEDWVTYQYGISYGTARSQAEVYETLRGLGVTHLQWFRGASRSWDSIAADIRFFDFALNRARDHRRVGRSLVATMPAAPPSELLPDVVFLACARQYPRGLYSLADLAVPSFGPLAKKYPKPRRRLEAAQVDAKLLETVSAIILEAKCAVTLPPAAAGSFIHAATRKSVPKLRMPTYDIYLRKVEARPAEEPPPEAPAAPDLDVVPDDE